MNEVNINKIIEEIKEEERTRIINIIREHEYFNLQHNYDLVINDIIKDINYGKDTGT